MLTAKTAGDYIVGYQSQDTRSLDDLDEVLCGSYQHALSVLDGSAPLGAWELFAPMALTQYSVGGVAVTSGCTCRLRSPNSCMNVSSWRTGNRTG